MWVTKNKRMAFSKLNGDVIEDLFALVQTLFLRRSQRCL